MRCLKALMGWTGRLPVNINLELKKMIPDMALMRVAKAPGWPTTMLTEAAGAVKEEPAMNLVALTRCMDRGAWLLLRLVNLINKT